MLITNKLSHLHLHYIYKLFKMSKNWADMDSDSSDDEGPTMPVQPAGMNDGTTRVSWSIHHFIYLSFFQIEFVS